MSLLLRCGFLIRHPDSGGLYYFSIANAGMVVRSILNGRKVHSSYTSSNSYVLCCLYTVMLCQSAGLTYGALTRPATARHAAYGASSHCANSKRASWLLCSNTWLLLCWSCLPGNSRSP